MVLPTFFGPPHMCAVCVDFKDRADALGMTHWLTTLKDSATQLLMKYKSGALVTQCWPNTMMNTPQKRFWSLETYYDEDVIWDGIHTWRLRKTNRRFVKFNKEQAYEHLWRGPQIWQYNVFRTRIWRLWGTLHKLGISSQIFICLFCFEGDNSIFYMWNKWWLYLKAETEEEKKIRLGIRRPARPSKTSSGRFHVFWINV